MSESILPVPPIRPNVWCTRTSGGGHCSAVWEIIDWASKEHSSKIEGLRHMSASLIKCNQYRLII